LERLCALSSYAGTRQSNDGGYKPSPVNRQAHQIAFEKKGQVI
jgi:hypothetical protein